MNLDQDILIGWKKQLNDVSDMKLHGHIKCVATWKLNLLLIKCLLKEVKNKLQESYNVKYSKEI